MAKRLTEAERRLRALTERDFQVAYVRALRAAGFLVGHHYDSRFSDPGTKGMPDLTIVGHGWFWMEELKRQQGELGPDQEKWIMELRPQVDVYVSRPEDWDSMMYLIEERSGKALDPELKKFPEPRKKKVSRRQPAPGTGPSPSSPAGTPASGTFAPPDGPGRTTHPSRG